MRNNERGRSMIEMLGVLAIVGILSIGGITGFSKAMTKHKLNKQTEQIVSILNYAELNRDSLFRHDYSQQSELTMTEILKKAGVFPQDMIREGKRNVYDAFGNEIHIGIVQSSDTLKYFELILTLDKNAEAEKICMNMVLLAKHYSPNLWRVKFGKSGEKQFWGDEYCAGRSGKCLKDATMTEIVESCAICKEEGSKFWFQYIL